MRYVSTRGRAPALGFGDALLAGLASDGGLYVPETWPALPDLTRCVTYADAATAVASCFVGDEIADATLARCATEAYATFRHPAVVPLVQLDHRQWLAELFHGPTFAFKDVALQLVGRLFDHVLKQRSDHITIIGATSGDTGSAAIDAVRGRDNIDIVMLFPNGRVTDVQRRQMTTVEDANVHIVAIDGTFDDCQDLVKAMFLHPRLASQRHLSAVNSINWGRVMAQVTYYATTSLALGGEAVFVVPTGNFGNVFAGWVARRMGAPIDRFVLSTNANDILARFLNDGDMSMREVVPTLSPSMDIQVSSNFERLLFEMNDRDGGMTAEQLDRFRSSGRLDVEPDQRAEHLDGTFSATRVDDDATLAEIHRLAHRTGVVVDPHTATATAAASLIDHDGPVVALATAHPAKFADAVARALGQRPELPEALAELHLKAERFDVVANDLESVAAHVERVTAAT